MAENNQRSYPGRWRGAEERPRAQGDDPLAELARLIGHSVPMNKTSDDRRPAPSAGRRELDRAAGYATPDEVLRDPSDQADTAAPEDVRYKQDLDSDFRAGRHERYEPRANPAPSPHASRFRQEPDFAIGQAHDAHEPAYQEAADWHDPSLDAQENRHPDEDEYEYENETYDAEHDGYDEEYGEDLHTGRRGGFVFVAAIFSLAVLGTAGAFAYRTMLGAPALPALPPIIKAEGGPNKIIPSDANSQTDATHDADPANAGSGERLVSREERPVDIPPPVTNNAPRPVATVPVFPDPPAMGGPGGVVGYSANPSSGSPAISTEPPAPAANPMTTATAPNPSPNQAVPPAAPAVSTATPTASGPKKIRTVTIHTDQSGAPDAVASSNVPARGGTQPPQGGNAPLSIVPSSTEAPASAAAAPARPRPTTAQPVPLNKPAANQTASATPAVPVAPAAQAAPVATGGSYVVQVSSQRSEAEAQSSFRDLQTKYPNVLGDREPIIRRADLGAKGIYFRAMVGPFTAADQATELCSNLKAAGGSCIVQKN